MECCAGPSEAIEELTLQLDEKPPTIESSKQSLSHTNWQARQHAVYSLGMLGQESLAEVVSVLQQHMLRDEHWRVRREAAKTLGMMGSEAVTLAENALRKACKDSDNLVRDAALKALTSNGHPVLPMHERSPRDPSSTVSASGIAGSLRVDLAAAPVEFFITVTRGSDRKTGLDVEFLDGPFLKVKHVHDGIFTDWNSTSPTKIEKGDFILEINGVRGDKKMLVEVLTRAPSLTVLVRKSAAGPPSTNHVDQLS
mmetsp:Transcript_84410/g.131839  ORF Transcript_84410/g.131839 Transcript_84410/m.131839 type:complete len:254 (+) Transcript_84410:98-859(+)